jgi:hypothetical protein
MPRPDVRKYIQWGTLQRTNATTNECYNEQLLSIKSRCYNEQLLSIKSGCYNEHRCYNEQLLSIKSGCYNEHRCCNEPGGILSADVARACA